MAGEFSRNSKTGTQTNRNYQRKKVNKSRNLMDFTRSPLSYEREKKKKKRDMTEYKMLNNTIKKQFI